MTTAMKPHQLLIVLLMLLFVVNLPPCYCSSQLIRSARYIQSLREARREAYSGQSGGWRVMNTKIRFVKQLVDRAAKQADVISTDALQGFCKVR